MAQAHHGCARANMIGHGGKGFMPRFGLYIIRQKNSRVIGEHAVEQGLYGPK